MIAGAEWLPALKPEKPTGTNAANEVAKKLTGRDYISWSAISTFWQSPLKYRFRYYREHPIVDTFYPAAAA
jgi:hypothetical protein